MTSPSASLRQLNGSRGKRRTVWALFLTLFLLILVVTITPLWISYPFRSQTPRGLETAYALHRWAPTITVIALVLILASSVYLWRGAGRWWRRIPLVMVPLIALTPTWFVRQNYLEWVFHPNTNPAFTDASDTARAGLPGDGDQVIAVEINGEAVAYPISQLAYHHVIEDTAGGVPIAATY